MCGSCYDLKKGEYLEHSEERGMPNYVIASPLETMTSLYSSTNRYDQATY